ncbi:glutamine synthetase family protein [Halomonas sp. BM-2019]|uniref:glutamine synthetase family protein n=1 Tax=Halomonas sp. BM-2019 TaxID=2811227 RepID=UPI0031FC907D
MTATPRQGRLTLEHLRHGMQSGELHTVVVAMADMQGRLQGKRMAIAHFLADVAQGEAEGCLYQLATDIDMNTVEGYRHGSWATGYGDFLFVPDLDTLRRLPWHPGSALVMCDLAWADHAPVAVSPRQILRGQIERLEALGLTALAAAELEFILFRESFAEAWHKGYRDLTPATRYNVDYSLLDTDNLEPLMCRLRNEMRAAGLNPLESKGECNFGQHEITFRYADALQAADNHAIYKHGAKEIAAQEGYSVTYMAKFNEREGSSCHIHMSLRAEDGSPVMAEGDRLSTLGERFVAGLLANLRELTLFFAPNINSYKRFASSSFAPTRIAWGRDNRTCALRLVGHQAPALRIENRVPGGDVNPYLALAAMIAAGLDGIERELTLEAPCQGNAYLGDGPRVPSHLLEARQLFADSSLARAAFGDEVVAHYLNMADIEIDAFFSAVTDWERRRGFERM